VTFSYDPSRAPKAPFTVRDQQKYHQGSGTATSDFRTWEQAAERVGTITRLVPPEFTAGK
jgi:hypothetical protein